jgi:glutathione synthase/RimK-type ligase-like ATP-grasp enzyme
MKLAIVSMASSKNTGLLSEAFTAKEIKPQLFELSKLGLITEDNKSGILLANKRFGEFDAIHLDASPFLCQFIEPFLSQIAGKGIYCPFKPGSFYEMSNNGAFFQLLNSAKVPVPKTHIFTSSTPADQAANGMSYPLSAKTFVKNIKSQSMIVESARSLDSLLKSFRAEVSMVMLQEFIEGDLYYCVVIGNEVLSAKRKWNAGKFTNEEKMIKSALSDDDRKLALRAAKNMGADILTVKVINGTVVGIKPEIDFAEFNKALGKKIEGSIAELFISRAGGDGK